MSRTTEILIVVDIGDEHHVEDLSFWLASQAPRSDDRVDGSAGHLLPMAGAIADEAWGGHKAPTSIIWAGVANYLGFDEFLDRVERVRWNEPNHVQPLMRDDGDPWFRVFMIRDETLRQYAPAPPEEDQDRLW